MGRKTFHTSRSAKAPPGSPKRAHSFNEKVRLGDDKGLSVQGEKQQGYTVKLPTHPRMQTPKDKGRMISFFNRDFDANSSSLNGSDASDEAYADPTAGVLDTPPSRGPKPPSSPGTSRGGGLYNKLGTRATLNSSSPTSNTPSPNNASGGRRAMAGMPNRLLLSPRSQNLENNNNNSGDVSPRYAAMMANGNKKYKESGDYGDSYIYDEEGSRVFFTPRQPALRRGQDHTKVVLNEDFTFTEIFDRLEEDDPDLKGLTIRQTGENTKTIETVASGEGADHGDSSAVNEAVTLVLPMHKMSNLMQNLADSVEANTSLIALDLNHNSILDESVLCIVDALMNNAVVQHLNLAHGRLTSVPASLAQLASECLVSLDLSYNGIGDSGAQELAGGIASSKSLAELNLTNCKVRGAGLGSLASAFAANKTLKSIILSGNFIGAKKNSKKLAFALMRNSRLRVLGLGCMQIGDGIEQFARLGESLSSLLSLSSLSSLSSGFV